MGTVQEHRGAGFLFAEASTEDVLTPEDMGDDERMMMAALQEFARKEVEPHLEEIEKRNIDVIRPLFEKAAALGIFMAEVPEEYGGLGLSVLAIAGMNESRSYLGPLASTVFAHQGIGTLPLINFGTQAQIDKYLPSCMDGTRMAAFALTEPSSGSDAMNIKTNAVLSEDGSEYILNGSKQFITNAGWADLFIVYAKVDGTQFSAFLLEGEIPGITVGENEKLLGLHGSSVCGLTLNNVHVPVENLLGEIGKGHKVALCTLNLGRLKMSANCAGYSKKVLKVAVEYAMQREQFGQPIANFGLIQKKLADMAARAYAAESVAYRTAGLVYTATESMGEEARHSLDVKLKVLTEFSIECALAKVFGTECFNALSDECLQVHGGYGFSEEYPAAKFYRDSRITRIYEGTSEICRLTAMKAILKRGSKGVLDLSSVIEAVKTSVQVDDTGDEEAGLLVLRERLSALKNVFFSLLGRALDRYGAEGLLSDENQSYLESLANIAMEIYAAESAVVRVLKIGERHENTRLPEDLAKLYAEQAVENIHKEATHILSTLYEGGELRAALEEIEGWFPLPANRQMLRRRISHALVENSGTIPEYRN